MSSSRVNALIDLATELQERRSLNELLQSIVDVAATLSRTERASIRLLDPSGVRLLSVCRAGKPIHENPEETFRVGEGLIGWIVQHGEPIRSAAADDDPRFVARPGMSSRLGSFIGVPLVVGRSALGVMSAVHPDSDYFTADDEAHLRLLAAISAPYVEMARLVKLANVDPLTGSLNRRALETMVMDSSDALCVCLLDIDHFKAINDTYGHGVGDHVLREVVRSLGGIVRDSDAVVRLGGEEFLLVLPGLQREVALKVAERVRVAVMEKLFQVGEVQLKLTVSIGVAERVDDESRDALIERADAAMYRAKEGGRNQVAFAE